MSSAISSSPNHSHNPALPILPIKTPSRKWHALTTRTSCPTLPFYYGVLATKIYCRPTCTARLARRANVVYFDSAQAAQSAGYRACRRCRPDDELFFGEPEEVVMKTMAVIGKRQGKDKGGLTQMAAEVGVTKSYLCRAFKKTMGVTVGEYIREFEMDGTGNTLALSADSVPSSGMAIHEASSTAVPQHSEGEEDVHKAVGNNSLSNIPELHRGIGKETFSSFVDGVTI